MREIDLPVEQSSEGPGKEGNIEVGREAEDEHAERGTGETGEQDGLPADLVAEPSPEHARGELGQCECRSDHAGVEGDLARVVRYMETLHHLVDVGEYPHEGNRFTYAAHG